jgi:N-acetylglucosaminyldiphosphoundecaprenol N-acetyl-beta-D-mannosaminyltransferase
MKHTLFGVRLCAINVHSTAHRVLAAARYRMPMTVSSLAVHGLMLAARNSTYRHTVNSFDLLCADGHPVRWLLNLKSKSRIGERVCGTDLMDLLCAQCATHEIGVYLYGSTPSVMSLLTRQLKEKYPKLSVRGAEPSVFRDLTAQEDAALVERINASGAGVVFLGLGCPLQEKFAYAHRNSIAPVQVCVGAAFDFLSGNKTRAPLWMQRFYLEWLHRLVQEPRRLGWRYLTTNSMFLWMTLRWLLLGRSSLR